MTTATKQLIITACIVGVCIILYFVMVQARAPKEAIVTQEQTSTGVEEAAILTKPLLDESLAAGTAFLLYNQKPEGNFVYEYDFLSRTYSPGDNQVRQAGALWGVSLLYKEQQHASTKEALVKGLNFFSTISKTTSEGDRFLVYPGESKGRTGTVALVSLALIEFLQTDLTEDEREQYATMLDEYLGFLLTLRMVNGQFHASFTHKDGVGVDDPSPYFDGESLLALAKAAKYAGYEQYADMILESAERMYTEHVTVARREDPDSATTKGFYQWGSMAFCELFTSEWDRVDVYAERTIDLAYWMIDTHKTLERTRNTAYAYEGLAVAWELARLTHNTSAKQIIGSVIHEGMLKLTSWQVGGPNQNEFLRRYAATQPETDQSAYGGVMNRKDESLLRIDVAQHQMHAVILVRRYLFSEK